MKPEGDRFTPIRIEDAMPAIQSFERCPGNELRASVTYPVINVRPHDRHNSRGADLQNVASDFLIFAEGLSYDLSKFSDDFTPFFRLWKTISKSLGASSQTRNSPAGSCVSIVLQASHQRVAGVLEWHCAIPKVATLRSAWRQFAMGLFFMSFACLRVARETHSSTPHHFGRHRFVCGAPQDLILAGHFTKTLQAVQHNQCSCSKVKESRDSLVLLRDIFPSSGIFDRLDFRSPAAHACQDQIYANL